MVDIQIFESRKKKIDEMAQLKGPAVLEQLDMKAGPAKEAPRAKSDLAEQELRDELKKFYDSASDKEVVVYNGPWIRVPGKSIASYQEKDFVLVNKNTKTVYNYDLKQLQNHIEAQSRKPNLWIACAGIEEGRTEHFERSYLTSLLPPDFHIPQMDIPLRNTKQTLAMARLEGNTKVKDLDGSKHNTKPVYNIPDLMIDGVQGNEFILDIMYDDEKLTSAVEEACKEVLVRTGGAGFPLLFDWYEKASIVKRGVERAGATAIFYPVPSKESCSESEVEEWLRRRRSGKEERVLILDQQVIRGWEASHLLVVNLYGDGLENLIMRAVGYCALVSERL